MTREAAANMSPPTAPPPPPAERTGFAVLAAGQPLERWTFSETAPLAPTEVDIRVTVRAGARVRMHEHAQLRASLCVVLRSEASDSGAWGNHAGG
jgi:hypothetical protein